MRLRLLFPSYKKNFFSSQNKRYFSLKKIQKKIKKIGNNFIELSFSNNFIELSFSNNNKIQINLIELLLTNNSNDYFSANSYWKNNIYKNNQHHEVKKNLKESQITKTESNRSILFNPIRTKSGSRLRKIRQHQKLSLRHLISEEMVNLLLL